METPFELLTDVSLAVSKVDVDLPLFLDTETIGLYGKIRLLQMYQEGMPHVILVEYPCPINTAALLNRFTQVYHNAHYDITTMQQQTETRYIPQKFYDTFLLERLASPKEEKFSLDASLERVLGFCPYERQKLKKKELQKSNWGAVRLSREQLLYAATDVYYMPQLWNSVKHNIGNINYELDILTLRYCLDFQWNGMYVDQHRLEERELANHRRVAELGIKFNVNSWQQVRSALNSTESDDLALARMANKGNQLAADVRETRKLLKQNSFINKFKQERIYGKFKPTTRSGRLSSDDQNMQQLPRALKGMFGAPPGKVLIYADYAQLELRTICAITACKNMENLFRQGTDLHGYTAEMVFGSDWTKQHRVISKTYNFNFLYGGGISMVQSILLAQANIDQPEKDATAARRKWRNLWPEIYAWQESGATGWRRNRIKQTPLGREYKGKLLTDHLNIENQGAGAEVAKLALHRFYNELKSKPYETALVNFIHDSFIIEVDDDPAVYQEVAALLADAMQQAWFEMSKCFKIKDLPMPVEVAVGTNWGDIENDDVDDIWNYTLEGMTHATC